MFEIKFFSMFICSESKYKKSKDDESHNSNFYRVTFLCLRQIDVIVTIILDKKV